MSDNEYRIALRPLGEPDAGLLDDVVVKDVTMFRAEIMDHDWLWMACYFPDEPDERLVMGVRAVMRHGKSALEFYSREQPFGAQFPYEPGAAHLYPPVAAASDTPRTDQNGERG